MKTNPFIRALLPLLLLSGGCAARKPIQVTVDAARHAAAIRAIEQRRFMIELDDAYFRNGKPPVPADGSYLAIDGMRGTMNFSPAAFRRKSLDNLYVVDENAQLIKDKAKKNGDMLFTIKILGHKPIQGCVADVTLYNGTNSCLVRCYGVHFSGRIVPLNDRRPLTF